jgi:hypothetical protein
MRHLTRRALPLLVAGLTALGSLGLAPGAASALGRSPLLPTSGASCGFVTVDFGDGPEDVYACLISNGDGLYTYADSTGRIFGFEG